jgi:virginiamycin B lyase
MHCLKDSRIIQAALSTFIVVLLVFAAGLLTPHAAAAYSGPWQINRSSTTSLVGRTIVLPVQTAPRETVSSFGGRLSQYAGATTTLPGSYQDVQSISYDAVHHVFYVLLTSNFGALYRVTPRGDATYITYMDSTVQGVAYDASVDTVFVTDTYLYEILAVNPHSGQQTVFAGGTHGTTDGHGTSASFQQPQGIVADPTSGTLYVTDLDRIRVITTSADVTTLTAPGAIGPPSVYSYSPAPEAITIDPGAGNLFVADPYQNVVHLVAPSGTVSTLAGTCFTRSQEAICDNLNRSGTFAYALFGAPCGIALDSATGALYVADSANYQIRKLAHGVVTTLSGNGHAGASDGVGDSVSFDFPIALAVLPGSNEVYVADYTNGLIRVVKTHGSRPPPPPHGVKLYDTPSIEAGPTGIAVTADGSVWYSESSANEIAELIPGGRTKEFPLPSGFVQPGPIVVGSDNNLWFADVSGVFPNQLAAIGRLTPSGKIKEFQTPFSQALQSIALGPDGNIWFLIYLGGIGFITPAGMQQAFVSDSGASISTGFDGDLWITTFGNFSGGIDRFATTGHLDSRYSFSGFDGGAITRGPGQHLWVTQPEAVGFVRGQTLVEYPLPGCTCNYALSDITMGGDRALWVTESGAGYIGRMTTGGIYSSLIVPAPRSAPMYVTTAPNGVVWFTDPGAQQIGLVY